MSRTAVFVVGPNGAGKGTVGRAVVDATGFACWGMGEILREIVRSKTADSVAIGAYLSSGELLPDRMIYQILDAGIQTEEYSAAQGIVFDGLPRTLPQLGVIKQRLVILGFENFYTLYCKVPQDQLEQRLQKQARKNRYDSAAIQRRLQVYADYTKPMIEVLRAQPEYYEVDTTPPKAEVGTTTRILIQRILAAPT